MVPRDVVWFVACRQVRHWGEGTWVSKLMGKQVRCGRRARHGWKYKWANQRGPGCQGWPSKALHYVLQQGR